LRGSDPTATSKPTAKGLAVTAAHGRLFGLFPVNVLHNLVHLGFGVWGILAYRSVTSSFLYARAVAIIYAVFVLMGLIPVVNTVFGLLPLHGHDIWLHAVLAGAAAYFGFMYRAETDVEDAPVTTGTGEPPPAGER
jgi:hypothetical protein